MCLPANFLAIFLTLIGPDSISSEPGRYIIHADSQDAHWVLTGDDWCTMAPQIDRMHRRASLRSD
ncbi:MAG: hypothetical protein AAF366_08750 [Pseudomonadota bacterium]